MTTQPEPLRLADELRAAPERSRTSFEAAAELRRLHTEVMEQARLNGMGAERELKLMAENEANERNLCILTDALAESRRANQELLEALRSALPMLDFSSPPDQSYLSSTNCFQTLWEDFESKARAAIAKHGGET